VTVTERIPDPSVVGIPLTITVVSDCVASKPGGRVDDTVILLERARYASDANVNVMGEMAFPTIKEVDGTFDVTDTVTGITVRVRLAVPLDVALLAVIAKLFDHTVVAVPLKTPVELSVRPGGRGDVDEYVGASPDGNETAVN
jgi:hypothetical protein